MKIKISQKEVEAIVLEHVRKTMGGANFNACEINTYRYGDDFCEVFVKEEDDSKSEA